MSSLNSNIKRLLINQVISTFSSTFGTFAVSWIVYDITDSKIAMGGLWLVSISASLLVQFLVGPVIDRYRRTSMMKLSEIIRALSYLSVLVFLLVNQVTVEKLYIASFLSSIVVYDSAANALIPKITDNKDLIKVNAKMSGATQLIRLLTFPISGFFITFLGHALSLTAIILLFLSSFVMIYSIQESPSILPPKQSWYKQFKNGLQIYQQHKILIYLSIFIASTSFGVFATQAMYIPYVTDILDGSSFDYGLFAAAFPLGYVIGTYLVGRLTIFENHLYTIMISSLFLGGCTYIFLGLTNTLWIALMIEATAGIFMPFWNVYSSTLYQKIVPESLLGQVYSVRYLLTKAVTPLGIVFGTFIATAYSIPILFLTIGIFIIIVSGLGIVYTIVFSKDISIKQNSVEIK